MHSTKKDYGKIALEYITVLLMQVVSIIRVIVKSKIGIKLPKRISDICYVIGNGPSFKESVEELSQQFVNHDLFVVNGFALSDLYTELKPSYYVMLDPVLFTYDGEKASSEMVLNTFTRIIDKTSWPLKLFVPTYVRNYKLIGILQARNKHIELCYYNNTFFEGFNKIKFWFFKHNLSMPQPQNILIATIFLTINMQYDEVRIIGADHSWHEEVVIASNNKLSFNDRHFYNQSGVRLEGPTSISQFFLSLYKAFRGHEILAEYAKEKGVSIINMSKKSYIDAYQRE